MESSQCSRIDIVFRHQKMGLNVFEIQVRHLFLPELASEVDIEHSQHLSWQGRRLSSQEDKDVLEALSLIEIQSLPRKAERLGEGSFTLQVNTPSAQACYEWWGSLPPAWHSLQALIDALESLVTPREL